MPIRATCPACGCHGDVEAFFAEDDSKRLLERFAGMEPALGRAVLGYLRLFKPPKTALRVSRAATVVDDLVALVSEGTVCKDERTGTRRPAPVAVWVDALNDMLANPPRDTPLSNNNYLRMVAFRVAGEHQARGPVVSSAPAIRPGGVSPAVVVDRIQEQIEFLGTQLRYGKIDRATHDAKVAELRSPRP